MEGEIKEIKEDIKLINQRVIEHDKSIIRLEESHSFIQRMAEEVTETNKALNQTMQDMKLTLVTIQSNLNDISGKVEGVSNRMDKFEDDTNINILTLIKKYWSTIALAIIFVSYYVLNKYGIHI